MPVVWQVVLACQLAQPKHGIKRFIDKLKTLSDYQFCTHDNYNSRNFEEEVLVFRRVVVQFVPKAPQIWDDAATESLKRFLQYNHLFVDIAVDDQVTPSELLKLCNQKFIEKIEFSDKQDDKCIIL